MVSSNNEANGHSCGRLLLEGLALGTLLLGTSRDEALLLVDRSCRQVGQTHFSVTECNVSVLDQPCMQGF